MYANGAEDETIDDKVDDAQSVSSHRSGKSSQIVLGGVGQKENERTANTTPDAVIAARASESSSAFSHADAFQHAVPPSNVVLSIDGTGRASSREGPTADSHMTNHEHKSRPPSTLASPLLEPKADPVNSNIERPTSPTASDISSNDSTPHVIRSTMSVDFPSKLPSPARRSSLDVGRQRSPSINSNFSPGHRKAQSVATTSTLPTRRSRVQIGISTPTTSQPLVSSPLASRIPRSSIDAGVVPNSDDTIPSSTSSLDGQSRPSTAQTDDDPTLTTTIGAARHERKLLDLEISNSSLLAINRSLEREVLKQKSELRKLRRATRGTSVSLGSRASLLSEVSFADSNDGNNSEASFASPSYDLDNIDNSTMEDGEYTPTKNYGRVSSIGGGTEIPHFTTANLSKHKEILIDSQKMNLSLQRCLGITEQLLKDATRSLEYQPQVAVTSSPVLTPVDEDQDGMRGRIHHDSDDFVKDWDWTRASSRLQGKRERDGSVMGRQEDNVTDWDSGVDVNEKIGDYGLGLSMSPSDLETAHGL